MKIMKRKYIKLGKIKETINQKTKAKTTKSFNYGFAILRPLLAFLVVAAHNFNSKSTKNKYILNITKNRLFHVPCFFIMSFYLTHKSLLSLNLKAIIYRLLRLLIPYIGWPMIVMKLNHIYNKKHHTNYPDTYRQLKLQFLWGKPIIGQLWFQWHLIVFSIFFIIIIFIFRKHTLFILHLLLISVFVVQYKGFDYNKYLINFPNESKRTLRFFFGAATFPIIGFTLGFCNIIDYLGKRKIKTLVISVIIYYILENYQIFHNTRGFGYVGIELNIKSLCLIFIFSSFPSEKIKNKYLSKFIIVITNYTAGVFYLHIVIQRYFSDYFNDLKRGTFRGLFIDYIICYFICFFGMLIFGKTPIKHMFC